MVRYVRSTGAVLQGARDDFHSRCLRRSSLWRIIGSVKKKLFHCMCWSRGEIKGLLKSLVVGMALVARASSFLRRSSIVELCGGATNRVIRPQLSTYFAEHSAMTFSSVSMSSENTYEMTEDEKYLFDLNGFLVVRNVLSAEDVAAANRAIDKHQSEMNERISKDIRNAKPGTPMYGSGPGRKDLGGVLEWDLEDSKVFKSILAHPKLVPRFHALLGKGYRMDHLPYVIAQDKGAEGFHLHGGTGM